MEIEQRSSIRILLLNPENKLLLFHCEDPKTTAADGTYHGPFWVPVGGGIEQGEAVEQAALRELYEETGLTEDLVELGPIVWHGSFEMIRCGIQSHLYQRFMVAHTQKTEITLDYLTSEEKEVVTEARWFSLDEMKTCKEVIYPVVMQEYLPDILAGKYPEHPIEIDLAKKPDMKEL